MADKLKKEACYLVSRANYPITITYDGKEMILPPHARDFKLADHTKVGVLPSLVRKVIIKGE